MIVSGFSNPTALQANGIIIGGKKYMTLRVEDVVIQGKLGAGGVSIARSHKCKSNVLSLFFSARAAESEGFHESPCRRHCRCHCCPLCHRPR